MISVDLLSARLVGLFNCLIVLALSLAKCPRDCSLRRFEPYLTYGFPLPNLTSPTTASSDNGSDYSVGIFRTRKYRNRNLDYLNESTKL